MNADVLPQPRNKSSSWLIFGTKSYHFPCCTKIPEWWEAAYWFLLDFLWPFEAPAAPEKASFFYDKKHARQIKHTPVRGGAAIPKGASDGISRFDGKNVHCVSFGVDWRHLQCFKAQDWLLGSQEKCGREPKCSKEKLFRCCARLF